MARGRPSHLVLEVLQREQGGVGLRSAHYEERGVSWRHHDVSRLGGRQQALSDSLLGRGLGERIGKEELVIQLLSGHAKGRREERRGMKKSKVEGEGRGLEGSMEVEGVVV